MKLPQLCNEKIRIFVLLTYYGSFSGSKLNKLINFEPSTFAVSYAPMNDSITNMEKKATCKFIGQRIY